MDMKFLLLLIAFQVVLSVLAKRKKKQKAEAARRESEASGNAAGATAAATVHSRKPAAILGRGSYDESEDGDEAEEEWDEHHMRGESRSEGRDPRRSQADPRHPAPNKATELGKDLLTQLAKELGLEIPTSAPEKPAPKPQTARPPAKPAPLTASRQTAIAQRGETAVDRMEQAAARSALSQSAKTQSLREHRDRGESSPRRAPSTVPVTMEPVQPRVSDLARESLSDPDTLRRAFILKSILDKPLSLQPRRPGQG